MAGIYAADGTINVTVVDGSSFVGAYAADGSWNVQVAPDPVTAPVGLRAPCGALYVTVYQGSGPTPLIAPDGSMYVVEGATVTGAQGVTVVTGSLSGGVGTLTLTLDGQALTLDSQNLQLGT